MIRITEAKFDKTLHVGGYPACAVAIEDVSGIRWLYRRDQRPDTAIELARSVWRNRHDLFNYTVAAVHVINQKTGTARDTISEG